MSPPGGWRTRVVVASTDEVLAAVVEEWIAVDPELRSAAAPSDGVVSAQNAVADVATDVVAFLAEGAVMPPTWVLAHARVYERAEVGAATGSVGLCWPDGRPTWWTAEYDTWLGVREVGDHALTVPDGFRLSPHNSSIRRSAMPRSSAGSRHRLRIAAGEAVSVAALRAAGWHAVRVPDAPVVRHITVHDTSTSKMLRLGREQGRRAAEDVHRRPGPNVPRAAKELWRAWLAMVRMPRMAHGSRTIGLITASNHLGQARTLAAPGTGRARTTP